MTVALDPRVITSQDAKDPGNFVFLFSTETSDFYWHKLDKLFVGCECSDTGYDHPDDFDRLCNKSIDNRFKEYGEDYWDGEYYWESVSRLTAINLLEKAFNDYNNGDHDYNGTSCRPDWEMIRYYLPGFHRPTIKAKWVLIEETVFKQKAIGAISPLAAYEKVLRYEIWARKDASEVYVFNPMSRRSGKARFDNIRSAKDEVKRLVVQRIGDRSW